MIMNENKGNVEKLFETLSNIQSLVNEFRQNIIVDEKVSALDLVRTYELKVNSLKKSNIFEAWQIDYINWGFSNELIFIDALNTICNKLYGRIYSKEDFIELEEAMRYVWSKISQVNGEEYFLFKKVLKLDTIKFNNIISDETDNIKGIRALILIVNIIQRNVDNEFDYSAVHGYSDFKNSFDTMGITSVDKFLSSLIKVYYVVKQGKLYSEKIEEVEGEQTMGNSNNKKLSEELMDIAMHYKGMCNECCEEDIYNDLFNFMRNNYTDKDYDDEDDIFNEDEDDVVYEEDDEYIELMSKISELNLAIATLKNDMAKFEERLVVCEENRKECKKAKLKKNHK